jgi:CRP-like cAMP-binding protein
MYFKQSDFFSGMEHGFVKDMMTNAERVTYEAGDAIFKEGDQTRHFYILIKGHVKLRIGRDGHTVFVISNAGECFGWSSLINRPRYAASAVCAAPTTLMRLDNADVRETLKKHPESGLIFMERLAGLIGARLLLSYQALSSLALLASSPTEGTGHTMAPLEPA